MGHATRRITKVDFVRICGGTVHALDQGAGIEALTAQDGHKVAITAKPLVWTLVIHLIAVDVRVGHLGNLLRQERITALAVLVYVGMVAINCLTVLGTNTVRLSGEIPPPLVLLPLLLIGRI